jgi:alanine-glyoxylate transaminase/serine-glyoxylate transaminase/serine-pyruvate transaminase
MENRLSEIRETLLMGPGPSCVYPQVYSALSSPTIGHLDPVFIRIMDGLKSYLQKLLHTQNRLTIPISGTGSAGMEACFVNLVEPGDSVLILCNGVFGLRMKDCATRLGAQVDAPEWAWGTPVVATEVARLLKAKTYKIVAVVHAETSTGVCNPVEEIGKLLRGSDTLYLVDAVTSLGGIPVHMDKWGIDALYSGTQKCLSCPPGLSPLSFSDRALAALSGRKNKVPSWYFDLSMITQYWEGQKRAYHHTAPINMIYALYQALALFFEEGEEKVYQRHMDNHTKLVAGFENMGLEMLVNSAYRLPMLNAVKIPDGADDIAIRSKLLNEHSIEIGAGLGALAGKVWRFGLMGHTARPENVERALNALKKVLA